MPWLGPGSDIKVYYSLFPSIHHLLTVVQVVPAEQAPKDDCKCKKIVSHLQLIHYLFSFYCFFTLSVCPRTHIILNSFFTSCPMSCSISILFFRDINHTDIFWSWRALCFSRFGCCHYLLYVVF